MRRLDAEFGPGSPGISVRFVGTIVLALAFVLSIVALVSVREIIDANKETVAEDERYMTCDAAIDDLQDASDFLTVQSRMYVMTGERHYLDDYLAEYYEVDRRGKALEVLHEQLGSEAETFSLLTDALMQSNALAQVELHALRLAASAYEVQDLPKALLDIRFEAGEQRLDATKKLNLAKQLVMGDDYSQLKNRIGADVDAGTYELISALELNRTQGDKYLDELLVRLRTIIGFLLASVILVVLVVFLLVLNPIAAYGERIRRDDPLLPGGGRELRHLATVYNAMYLENRARTEHLEHAAQHDPLTGLRNRGAYDDLLAGHADERLALVLIDVDYFKECNDEFGHEVGDGVLCKVATAIKSSFRTTDYPCRIGGDEFAVIMSDIGPDLKEVIVSRIESMQAAVSDTGDGLPGVTLSVGVAFSEKGDNGQEAYRKADSALYEVKDRGRNGYAFFGDRAAG